MPWSQRFILVLALLLIGCNWRESCDDTANWVDFVHLNGITYLRNASRDEGAVQELQLGQQHGAIQVKIAGNCGSVDPGDEGAAAYLPRGTLLYRVEGYAPEFRLAALLDEQVLLYEADTNSLAEQGADLLDIGGKVEAIGIATFPEGEELAVIEDPERVASLVEMVLKAPVEEQASSAWVGTYNLEFRLDDGTTVERPYSVDSQTMVRGIALPDEFTAAIEQAVSPDASDSASSEGDRPVVEVTPPVAGATPTIDMARLLAPLDCPVIEDANYDYEAGSGYETPQQALESFNPIERPPGTPVLIVEETNRFIWAFIENGEKVGTMNAMRETNSGLWNISGIERCANQ